VHVCVYVCVCISLSLLHIKIQSSPRKFLKSQLCSDLQWKHTQAGIFEKLPDKHKLTHAICVCCILFLALSHSRYPARTHTRTHLLAHAPTHLLTRKSCRSSKSIGIRTFVDFVCLFCVSLLYVSHTDFVDFVCLFCMSLLYVSFVCLSYGLCRLCLSLLYVSFVCLF